MAGGPAAGAELAAGELAAAGELTGAGAAAELAGADGALLAGTLLVAGELAFGAAEADAEAAGLDDAACGLELLLHPTNARDTDAVTATDDQTLKRDNSGIS